MNLEMKLTHRKSVTAFLIYAAAGVGWPVGVLGGDGAENGMAAAGREVGKPGIWSRDDGMTSGSEKDAKHANAEVTGTSESSSTQIYDPMTESTSMGGIGGLAHQHHHKAEVEWLLLDISGPSFDIQDQDVILRSFMNDQADKDSSLNPIRGMQECPTELVECLSGITEPVQSKDVGVYIPDTGSASDICPTGASIEFTEVRVNGICPNSFVLTREWVALDCDNDSNFVKEIITVIDTIAPVYTPKDDMLIWPPDTKMHTFTLLGDFGYNEASDCGTSASKYCSDSAATVQFISCLDSQADSFPNARASDCTYDAATDILSVKADRDDMDPSRREYNITVRVKDAFYPWCGNFADSSNIISVAPNHPSASPTARTNPTPTLPSSSNWEIIYFGLSADFGANSATELSLEYDISVGREHETEIFEKDCETPITDINITQTVGSGKSSMDEVHDRVVLAYDFDRTAIASSSLWNVSTNQLAMCQVVRLIIPANGTDPKTKMVITEDKRVLEIDFDLSVDFQLDNDLGAGSVGEGAGSTNVDSYVEACKCDGVQSFTCDSSPLLPNIELIICIKSVSPDVEIDILNSMVVTQNPASMDVIVAGQVEIPSITSREYVPGMNGVVVSTRVPPNLFSFGAGSSITIAGGVGMKFVDSGLFGRKLLASSNSAKKFDEKESYEVRVDLAHEMTSDGEVASINSASFVKNLGFASLVTILVFSYNLV